MRHTCLKNKVPQMWVVYTPRLYSGCGGPTSIPCTVQYILATSLTYLHAFSWHTVGLLMTKSIADAVKVSFKHLCNLEHLRYSCILNTGKPEFKIRLCFGEGRTFKNPLEFFA